MREQILAFLRDPKSLAASAADPEVWLAGLRDFAAPSLAAHNEHPLRSAQLDAWTGLAGAHAGLVLGPPGTGKTHLLSWLILGYIHARRAAGLPARVYVTARSEEHTSELQSLMRISYAVLCLKKKKQHST